MPYQFESRVRYSEMGLDRKLTLAAVTDYFQDCSTFQSEECGNGLDLLQEQGLAWMVLSWQMEIARRPALGEKIAAQTWPYAFKAFYGYRNFTLLDEDGAYLVKANSVWALMDMQTGKPAKVPGEIISHYQMEQPLEMGDYPRKIQMPKDCVRRDAFVIGRHHLDTNHHVNNSKYIGMADEYLPEGFEPSLLRVGYRRQARLHDVIVPMVHREADEITVSLCDEEEKPYAVVMYVRQAGFGSAGEAPGQTAQTRP